MNMEIGEKRLETENNNDPTKDQLARYAHFKEMERFGISEAGIPEKDKLTPGEIKKIEEWLEDKKQPIPDVPTGKIADNFIEELKRKGVEVEVEVEHVNGGEEVPSKEEIDELVEGLFEDLLELEILRKKIEERNNKLNSSLKRYSLQHAVDRGSVEYYDELTKTIQVIILDMQQLGKNYLKLQNLLAKRKEELKNTIN